MFSSWVHKALRPSTKALALADVATAGVMALATDTASEYKKGMAQRYLFRQQALVFCNFVKLKNCNAKNPNGRFADPVPIYQTPS
jgi:hypothetical protein